MSLAVNDDFLDAIAQQARVAYATQQLNACRKALQGWQADAAREAHASDPTRLQDELAYYTQQVARWQDYLGRLETESSVVASMQVLMALDVPQYGK